MLTVASTARSTTSEKMPLLVSSSPAPPPLPASTAAALHQASSLDGLHTSQALLAQTAQDSTHGSRGSWAHELRSYFADGGNMIVRSTLLQGSFVVVTVCVARMGSSALAAHQVVLQLWLLTSYIVDGFAAAGTVLGSRLAAKKVTEPESLKCALCLV